METVEASPPAASSREANFVAGTIARCQEDKGLAARLRRADNPATEYQSWEFLAAWHIDLEHDDRRLPYATVAAAIARAKPQSNGSLTLGQAIARCYDEGNQSDQAKARLRRLLACDDLPELCRLLRPVLTLVTSRVTQPLNYTRLLSQLCQLSAAVRSGNSEWKLHIKAQWAQEFYNRKALAEGEHA